MDDISIDRLVLDIPGLTTEKAKDLAKRWAMGLRRRSRAKATSATLTVDLNEQADEQKSAAAGRRHRQLAVAADRIGTHGWTISSRRADRVHGELPDPCAQRHPLPVQPRDHDAHVDARQNRRSRRAGPEPQQSSGDYRAAGGVRSRSRLPWTPATPSPTAAPSPRVWPSSAASIRASRRWRCFCFPPRPRAAGCVGSVSSALGLGGGPPPATAVPASQLPTVLFVWGPGRIAPVRVTTLTITEKLYDGTLLVPDACRGADRSEGAHAA